MAVGTLAEAATSPKAATSPVVPATQDRAYRLSVAQYEQMARLGILGEKERVVLWKGALVRPMTKNQPHSIALGEVYDRLKALVPEAWHLRQEQPIILADDHMPEPDLTVVRGARRDFPERPPTASHVDLVVEVADTSLAEDRGEMLEEYARRSIPTYWIVNIPGRVLEVHTEPTGPDEVPTYRVKRTFDPDEEVPVLLDGREVGRLRVRDILP